MKIYFKQKNKHKYEATVHCKNKLAFFYFQD